MADRETQTGKINGSSAIRSIGNSLFTAFFIYILEIIFVLAFTALIYSGELSSQIPRAMGFILFGDAILCVVVAWLSSYAGSIAVEQDIPGAMLGAIAVGIIATLAGNPEMQFATVTLMIVITTMMTGILLLVLGYFKLGGLVRFLPYPVIGGFLAGTGCLLVQGGIGIMANSSVILDWFQPKVLLLWMPGALLGVGVYYISQKANKPYIVPLLMLITSLLFYGLTWLLGSSISDLRTAGWLLDPIVSDSIWEFPLAPSFLSQVNWSVLLSQIPALAPIALISVIELLLNSSGMEVLVKKDIDLDRELVVAGTGNLFASLTGGLIGFQDISFSSLGKSMSGGKRLVGILTAVMIAATLFVGTVAALYIPKFVFGSVLVFIGIQLLMDWVYEAWFKFSRIEFLVVVTILVVLVVNGILEAVVVGLILAVTMFAISYSQISVIKYAFSGREFRSRMIRAPHEEQVLNAHGNELYLMKLEGFIFFGTANGIFEKLRQQIESKDNEEIKFALLDFSKIAGIDSTGMLSFVRMMQWCQDKGVTLIFTGLSKTLEEQFIREASAIGENILKTFIDMDHGIEWCENQIILATQTTLNIRKRINEQLRAILKNDSAEKLLPYLRVHEYHPGEFLIREGNPADAIYFIESGQVTVQIEAGSGKPLRLETMRGGRMVGEMAFYLKTERTASVVADQKSVVYSLSIEELNQMEVDNPEIANIFHRISVLLLSERLMNLTRTVQALERL